MSPAVRLLPAALALAASLVLPAPPARAQEGIYHLGMLTQEQRALLFQRVDSYALVETFLAACGRPPRLEQRLRRLAAGCIQAASVNEIAARFRRTLAAKASLRWNCTSAENRRMIARSEESVRALKADLGRACQSVASR